MMLLFPDHDTNVDIPGLLYIPEFISKEEHDSLLTLIDKQPWLSDLKRRVQHYGYKYDYKARNIDPSMSLGPLPHWLDSLCDRLVATNIFSQSPDQVIVNEYLPGQGISAHIDCTPCFKDIIVSLSLGSSCIMEFSNTNSGQKKSVFLEERSLVVLSDDARYQWTHAIPARKSDVANGIKIPRGRRVSLTFRNAILEKDFDS